MENTMPVLNPHKTDTQPGLFGLNQELISSLQSCAAFDGCPVTITPHENHFMVSGVVKASHDQEANEPISFDVYLDKDISVKNLGTLQQMFISSLRRDQWKIGKEFTSITQKLDDALTAGNEEVKISSSVTIKAKGEINPRSFRSHIVLRLVNLWIAAKLSKGEYGAVGGE
jgi:hypothetical protein